MSAPKIRHSLKEARRMQRQAHQRLRLERPAFITVVQDELTKEVLGVLIGREVWDKFATKSEVDLSHAELIDFELTV